MYFIQKKKKTLMYNYDYLDQVNYYKYCIGYGLGSNILKDRNWA